MNNSLLLGKYIKKFINEDEAIMGIIEGRVYPCYVNQDTPYPFIVYSRSGLVVDYTKDGSTSDVVQQFMQCCSNDYEQSVDLVNAVRRCFENGSYKDDNINIVNIVISSCSEASSDGCYIQNITFDFEIK
jgi:hypothetical protein